MRRTIAKLLVGLGLLFGGPAAVVAQTTTDSATAPDSQPPATAEVRELSGTLQQSPAPEKPVQLGEPIRITITIVHEPAVDVVLPSSFASGRWELLDSSNETVQGEKEWTTRLELKLGVFRPGETTLAPFPIELVSADGEGVLMSEPVSVKAVTSLDDTEVGFSEPRPPVTVWVEDNTLLWVGGFGASALLLGLFLFAARRRREEEIAATPPRPAHEVALEKLGRLAGDDMVERGEHMVFYVLLSEAIREYLGRRYGFKAVEMTTTEILEALERAKVEWPKTLSQEDVANFLLHCDSVKFGGVVPTTDTASDRLRRAFTIVETTRPQGLPVVEEPQSTGEPVASSAPTEEADSDARWRPPSADETDPVAPQVNQEQPTEEPPRGEPVALADTAASEDPQQEARDGE